MATEDKINNEEQLQEDATVNQTEETQEQAESTNEEGTETPAVEIEPLEAWSPVPSSGPGRKVKPKH